jgi:hypothetical protein
MAGLVPAIHANIAVEGKTWMAGTSPAMTKCASVPRFRTPCLMATQTPPANFNGLLTTDSDFRVYRRHGRLVIPVVLPD